MSLWYSDGKEQLLVRSIPPEASVFVVGVNDEYEPNETHALFTVFEPNVILPEQELTTVTFEGGTLRADEPIWVNAGTGIIDRSLMLAGAVIYFKLGEEGALLCFLDSAQAGLPQELTGVNVTAKWNANGICRL